MKTLLSVSLLSSVLVLAPTTASAQRGSRGDDRSGGHAAPAPQHQAPAPRVAPSPPVQHQPAPAPIQRHEPPPTRTYNPPSPTPPVQHYSPPSRGSTPPSYSPPSRHESPPVRVSPGYQPPPSRVDRGYEPPSRSYEPPAQRGGVDTGGARTSPSPVRILPGDRNSDSYSAPPPAVGGAVRTRANTSFRDTPPREDRSSAGGVGGGSSSGSPSLRDLYRRVDRGDTGARPSPIEPRDPRAKIGPILNDSLAGRYRSRFDSDVERAKPAPSPAPSPRPIVRPDPNPPRAVTPGDPARTAPRAPDPIAHHRYPVPGREPIAKLTPTPSPRITPGIVRSESVPLYPAPRVGPTPPPRSGGGTGPRLNPSIGYRNYVQRNPRGSFYGSSHWACHRGSLSFSFGWGRKSHCWGIYSYPFYYGCWWPRSHWYGCWNFGLCWTSCWPSYAQCWWWPNYTTCYAPIVWDSTDYSYWDDPYYYDAWYSTPRSHVVVHEVVREGAGADVASTEPPSPAALAAKHASLGDFYFKEGRFQEAAESYLRALAYAPEDATLHFVLADALFATGDYHYAAFIIGKAIKLEPELARSNADKRSFYKDAKKFDEQLATLRAYLKDKSYDAAAWLVLGYNLRFSGDTPGAKLAFLRVQEIDPGHQTSRVFLDAIDAPASRPSSAADTSK